MNRSCWVVLRTDGAGERKRADKWGNLLILSARRRSKDAARANRMEVAMIMNVNMQVGAKQHPQPETSDVSSVSRARMRPDK